MMWRKIQKFTALGKEEKRLFVEAFVMLGVIRLKLFLFSFKFLTRSLKQAGVCDEVFTEGGYDYETVRKTSIAIQNASAHTPWQSACLVQSLTAWKMLQKRKIAGTIYLGVKKEDELKAHAWVRSGEIFVTGKNGHEGFKVITILKWR